MKKTLVILAIVAIMVLVGVLSVPGQELVARNRLSLEALKAAESGDAGRMLQVAGELEIKAQERCEYYWQAGRLRQLAEVESDSYYSILGCSASYLPLLQVTNLMNVDLAQTAVNMYPESSSAAFWLAEAVAKSDISRAEALYERAVEITPSFGVSWCRLGYIRENKDDLSNALNAFQACCNNADPGYHGCWGAGRVYEKLGDEISAISAYRLSTWENAHARADELEKKLKP